MGHGFWGGPLVNWFIWLLGVVIIVIVIGLILKALTQGSSHLYSRDKTALEILKERYAKGEIDREEFEQRKADLLKD